MSFHPFLKIRCLELGRDILETLVGDVHHYGGNIDQTLQRNLVSCPSYRCHSAMYNFIPPLFLLLLQLTLGVEMIGCVDMSSYMLTHTDVELEMLNKIPSIKPASLLTWAMKHPMALLSSSLTFFMVKGEFPGHMLRSLSPIL